MIRPAVRELVTLGPLPPSDAVDTVVLAKQEALLRAITKPLSDDEARELVKLFGPDECFGLAWVLVHLVESAPGWPLPDCLADKSRYWIRHLRQAAVNAGLVEK